MIMGNRGRRPPQATAAAALSQRSAARCWCSAKVQTRMSRTGAFFAHQHDSITGRGDPGGVWAAGAISACAWPKSGWPPNY